MINTYHILTLLSIPGVGRNTVRKIITKLDDANENNPWPMIVELLYEFNIKADTEVINRAEDRADEILKDCERFSITPLAFTHSDFPFLLKDIPDAPVLLFAKGTIKHINETLSIAVIGTREPTRFGRRMAERFGEVFAGAGINVVSGLAIGCDAGAHQGCLRTNGIAIAVLAHGLDRIYPAENKELSEQILHYGGCLLSEYAPGEKPRRNYFVERDRLQSGLSDAVVVVETDITGGTMHTVNFTMKQQRILACLNHPRKFLSPKSNGNQMLIEKGTAIPLGTEEEIQAFLKMCWDRDGKIFSGNNVPLKTHEQIHIKELNEEGNYF